jgi:hypothetical protein
MTSTTEIRISAIEDALTALWAYSVHGTQVVRVLADSKLAQEMGFTPTDDGIPGERVASRSTLIWCTQFGPLSSPAMICTYGNTIEQCLDKAEVQLSDLQQAVEAASKKKRPKRARKPTKLGRSVVPAAG